MASDWDLILRDALTKTLEELCFVAPDPESEGGASLPLEAVAQVGFAGPIVGHLLVRMHGQALASITLDMLGTDRPPEVGELADCLAEIANVACGTALPMLAGRRAVFDVRAPIVSWQAGAEPRGERVAQAGLGFDSGFAEVALFVEKDAAP